MIIRPGLIIRPEWYPRLMMPHMIVHADWAGTSRQQNAKDNKRAPGTVPVPIAKQLQNNINAARAERATGMLLPGLTWVDYMERGFRGLPDFFNPCKTIKIDAKGSWWQYDRTRLLFLKQDTEPGDKQGVKPDWMYVLAVGCWHPWWYFPGWIWGHEVLKRKPNTKVGWAIPQQELHPMYFLLRIVEDEG